MHRTLDKLEQYEHFTSLISPLLRQAIKENWSAEKLATDPQIQTLLMARQMTIALAEADSGKALAAIKDLRDRSEGKAVERVEQTHKLEKLPDDQLDAMLLSKLAAARGEDDETSDTIQ